MIGKNHIIEVETTLGKLKDGDRFVRHADYPFEGSIHRSFTVKIDPRAIREIIPDLSFVFVLREIYKYDRRSFEIVQLPASDACCAQVRADAIAGLISEEDDHS